MIDWDKVRVRELKQDGLANQRVERFAHLPLAWAAKAADATNTTKALVWIWLVQQARRTKSDKIVMSNEALAEYRISRYAKMRTLRQLEAAGLVSVDHCSGKAPVIRLQGLTRADL